MNSLRHLLWPFSLLYGIAVTTRNKLFDNGKLPSKSFDIPVITLGNLSTGGTGKTPHTEYITALLSPQNKIAVLSRGYGRKTTGYILSNPNSTSDEIGDEPKQIKSKFPRVPVAVCEKRVIGIENLIQDIDGLEAVVLDDAFQHRYVKPGFSILLTSFHSPFYNDFILPTGNLRENRSGAKRADIVIVTKCSHDLSAQQIQQVRAEIKKYSTAPVFFTGFKYFNPKGFSSTVDCKIQDLKEIVLVTGIANPTPLVDYLKKNKVSITEHLEFADHHNFTKSDLERIANTSAKRQNLPIITTEKDFTRIISNPNKQIIPEDLLMYIPIEVFFLDEQKETFDKMILDYVRNN